MSLLKQITGRQSRCFCFAFRLHRTSQWDSERRVIGQGLKKSSSNQKIIMFNDLVHVY